MERIMEPIHTIEFAGEDLLSDLQSNKGVLGPLCSDE